MLGRDFEAVSLADTGGSAFTKKCRPASSTTLAIWPLAPCAKKAAKRVAQRTGVARWSPAVIAVRFIIRLLPRLGRGRALGKASKNLGTGHRVYSFQHCRQAVNVPSVLGPPPNGLRLGRSLGEWLVLRIRSPRCHVRPAMVALQTVSRKTRF